MNMLYVLSIQNIIHKMYIIFLKEAEKRGRLKEGGRKISEHFYFSQSNYYE